MRLKLLCTGNIVRVRFAPVVRWVRWCGALSSWHMRGWHTCCSDHTASPVCCQQLVHFVPVKLPAWPLPQRAFAVVHSLSHHAWHTSVHYAEAFRHANGTPQE